MGSTIAIVVLIVLVLLIVVRNIYVVQQSKAYVIERLGAFHSVWGVGLHLKVPFIERVVKKVSLKEQVADFDPQPVITKDNVTMQIDTVIYFQITDPQPVYLRRRVSDERHREPDRHHPAQHHRRTRARPEPDQPRHRSTPRCAPSSTRRPIRGASRSTAWS